MLKIPYDADDDPPTLERAAPAATHAAALESGFPEEVETDVDHQVLGPSAPSDPEATRITVAPPPGSVPADFEPDTPYLPIDVATVLRRASAGTEPPPNPPREDDPEGTARAP